MTLAILTLIALMCAAILVGVAYGILLARRTQTRLRVLEAEVAGLPGFVWATGTLQRAVPSDLPLPNWNAWSMPPDLLALLAARIAETRPRLVVEFGSGLSTLVVAALLRDHGGRLVSYEHDADYAARQARTLALHGLRDVVDLRVVPIGARRHPPFDHPWYEIDPADLPRGADLVIVDGPPRAFGAEVRFPAGDLMAPRLAPGGAIVFDDADRPGERRVAEALAERHPDLAAERPPLHRGCLILTRPT